jgi:SAM-dependent methyltransferase
MAPDNLPVSQHYLGARGRGYFEDKFGSRAEQGRFFQARYFRRHINRNDVVLDFGCADGLCLRSIEARGRIGVEINPTALEKCSELSERQGIFIELHKDLSSVASDSVDVVISNHCLEHVVCPYTCLKDLKRVLKPNGYLLMVLPFDDWRKKGHDRWKARDRDNHLFTWSPMNIGNLLAEVGFEVEEARLCTTAWSPKIFWIRRLLGEQVFELACSLLARMKNSREVFCRAKIPE